MASRAQRAFKRLGGIAAINRIDNLKTGVSSGSGAWGQINSSHAADARTMGFHVDPHEARQPQQKGKVERRVGVFKRLDFRRVFNSVGELQSYTDETLQRDSVVRICPVTGLSVHETWLKERELLRPLPGTMPEPFDLIKQASVHKDCTIRFEGRTYSVPYRFASKAVEVRGCSQIVPIVDPQSGQIVKEFPRKTAHRLLIDQDCYEPSGGDSHVDCDTPRPLPLGSMAKRIEELASQGVAHVRSIFTLPSPNKKRRQRVLKFDFTCNGKADNEDLFNAKTVCRRHLAQAISNARYRSTC